MKNETCIKIMELGITQNFMKFAVVKKLPETNKKEYTYICDNHVWIYCKSPDESVERWHDLGSVSDFDDEERESDI